MHLPDPFPDSGPPQCQFHQGAYMHDHQALLECCKALELREIQLTTEHDTIRLMFEHLTSAVQLSKPDPFQLHDSKLDNFIEWLDTASSQMTDRRKIPYLKDENGDPVPKKTVKAIRKLLCSGWSELLNQKLAPQPWGKATASARQLIHMLVENAYPLFKFADDGWKLDYLAMTSVKKEDDDANNDNNNSNDQTGKKHRHSMTSVEPKVSSKKNKVIPTSLTPPLSTPAGLPALDIDVPGPLTSLTIAQAGSESRNTPSSPNLGISCPKSKPGVTDTKNTTEAIKSTTEPHVDSESTTEHLTNSENTTEPVTDSDETATSISNASSEPGPIPTPKPLKITLPNPLNLCAHRWLKQMKTNGTTDEFCIYYGSLSDKQRKEYDNKANTLATKNKWNKTCFISQHNQTIFEHNHITACMNTFTQGINSLR
ncbi:hypothetical protein EDD22DRAFT_848810 [Suillus occidentalis]|nr:hypothetical protein EDD22DRAFT_848810 [Suillus occidentalis]